MSFQSLDRTQIKNLADDAKIYSRGQDYFQSGMVEKIWLEGNKLFARVAGSYGNYKVEIENQEEDFICNCTCPYEGNNCKHIIAALLAFLDQKKEIMKQTIQKVHEDFDLSKKLLLLDKKDLVNLLIYSLKTHSNWKNICLKEIAKKFDKIGLEKENRKIYQQQFQDHLDRACGILHEFNEYGGGPDEEESDFYTTISEIVKLFKTNKLDDELKREFFDKMFYYYNQYNSGLEDATMDAIFEVAKTEQDWHYIIKKLQEKKDDYREGLVRDIYRNHLKDEKTYLKLREENLKHAYDFEDLVDFWTQKGKTDRAVAIAQQAVSKDQSSSSELLEYLFNHFKNKDYLLALDYLKRIYKIQSNLENYQKLKKFCAEKDWHEIDQWCRWLLQKNKARAQLAEIHLSNQEYDKVLDYVLSDIDSDNIWPSWDLPNKDEFAQKIIDKYPRELLPFYEQKINKHISWKDRRNYKIAASYANKIKEIYCRHLKQEDKWQNFITNIRKEYVKLPALLDEFKSL